MIERYTLHERICHWLTGFAYTYCLATGLAFYTPYMYWLAIVLGGGPTSRFWHPIIGVGFVLAQIWMHAIWKEDVEIKDIDKEWLDKSKYYVENQDDKLPPQEKFNGGQKVFYWVMFIGAFILLISGFFMWIPEYIPRAVRPWMVIVHEGAALITIGAFIIHVYMGVFMVPGSVRAMVLGFVSQNWARAHHRLWFHEKTGE